MIAELLRRERKADAAIPVEGYASLFAVSDHSGDVIRAGAFRASLMRLKGPLPLLVQHEPRLRAGAWIDVTEGARGLYVKGAILPDEPGAAKARRLIARGVDGLSIGFVPLVARTHARGRVLEEIDLIEVSLVTHPMQPLARLTLARGNRRAL